MCCPKKQPHYTPAEHALRIAAITDVLAVVAAMPATSTHEQCVGRIIGRLESARGLQVVQNHPFRPKAKEPQVAQGLPVEK